jgi:AAA domain
LVADISANPSERTGDEKAKALLADLIDWHRREVKPAWWRYFYVRALTADELVDEPDALGGLEGGDVIGEVKRSIVRRFSFPPQEYGFTAGGTAIDPETGRGWQVWSLDNEHGVVDLKVAKDYSGPLPAALVEGGPPDTRNLAGRLRDLGDRVVREGLTGEDAATALLLRLRPISHRARPGPLRSEGETATQAAVRLALALRDSYLPIQGPPGTGKTFTAAEQILDLIAQGRTVGITGPSHAVIHNLIDAVLKHATGRPFVPRIGQRAEDDNPFLHPSAARMSYDKLAAAVRACELDAAAGTIWMWARDQFQRSVDTLFVDEAGQMSLANILSVAGAARNLVLLGDPQQLAQPSQAAHPPGAGVSALEHILGDHATMPRDAGLLIDRTWRMHPSLCQYTSEVFYDGQLTWVDGLERQEIFGARPFNGSGLRIVKVSHEGNTSASLEEASRVARLVDDLVGREWCNKLGERQPVGLDQIMVVTPYNAQIRAIKEALYGSTHEGLRVGTVDKFQGREAPIVIYSMATSSADDAPRGLEFLYDLHRLNVATSRARAMAIIVASPDLVRVFCRTTRQMVLANALCLTWESGD